MLDLYFSQLKLLNRVLTTEMPRSWLTDS